MCAGLQRKLSFTFDQIRLRLGPKWLSFPLKPGQLGTKCGFLNHLHSLLEQADDLKGTLLVSNARRCTGLQLAVASCVLVPKLLCASEQEWRGR